MSQHFDIDDILREWPFEPGKVIARLIRADDGHEVLQMRIEMGLLQMETRNRPDGKMPGGSETYLDYLIQQGFRTSDGFELSEQQYLEVDCEFMQFYHRRICWLALRAFPQAVADADHTLALMDFVATHPKNELWTASHEQYRPFVLFHRIQAAALAELEASGPERAIEELGRGLAQLLKVFEACEAGERFDQDAMVAQLTELTKWVRRHYDVGRTLAEQLADAVASEQYELAAKLRDEIARRYSKDI